MSTAIGQVKSRLIAVVALQTNAINEARSKQTKKNQRNYYYSVIKGKVQPQNKLISDVRSDKIGDVRLSISLLVPKIFKFKVEKLLIYLVSYQNKGDCD